jgi:diaminohydroxyphosphoribosylaminopyrimidine deaminase/5-amino-6-(5-phosphoribosylamino)uracil reductase
MADDTLQNVDSPNTNFQRVDYQHMARAIQLAKKGQYTTHPNPRVGCVIVKDGQVIGEGYHQRAGEPHAEINAILQLQSKQLSARGATAYVTLEPCSHMGKTPPCANALVDAGVARVVIAMQDPNPQVAGRGIAQLKEAGIAVEVGLLKKQAKALNPGFIKRMEQGLPWVRVKLAMSLDGKTAMASGESQWITGSEARRDVQFLRAKADAILTGIGTVLADDPSLNVRLTSDDLAIVGEYKQPKRVILDSKLKTPLDAKLLRIEGDTLIFTSNKDTRLTHAFESLGAEVLLFEKDESGRLPLKPILQKLAEREVNEIHVEAGATLCGALIQENLVDEIIIYMAPTFLGGDAKSLLNFTGIDTMADKLNLEIIDIRAVGKDWRINCLVNH